MNWRTESCPGRHVLASPAGPAPVAAGRRAARTVPRQNQKRIRARSGRRRATELAAEISQFRFSSLECPNGYEMGPVVGQGIHITCLVTKVKQADAASSAWANWPARIASMTSIARTMNRMLRHCKASARRRSSASAASAAGSPRRNKSAARQHRPIRRASHHRLWLLPPPARWPWPADARCIQGVRST